MSAATLLLVLVAAALHAVWKLWAKQIGAGGWGVTLVWLLTAISASLYAPLGLAALGAGGRGAVRRRGARAGARLKRR